jgi:hypothetical protein
MNYSTEDVYNYYLKYLSKNKDGNAKKKYESYLDIGNKVYEASEDVCTKFFDIVKGLKSDTYSDMKAIFFPQRFLQVRIEELPEDRTDEIDKIIRNCFYLGFYYHFVFYTNFTRENVERFDFNKVFREWISKTLVAENLMSKYKKEQHGFTDFWFKAFYKEMNYSETFKRKYKFGLLERRRISSFFKNIFYSGVMFSMYYDLRTKKTF